MSYLTANTEKCSSITTRDKNNHNGVTTIRGAQNGNLSVHGYPHSLLIGYCVTDQERGRERENNLYLCYIIYFMLLI